LNLKKNHVWKKIVKVKVNSGLGFVKGLNNNDNHEGVGDVVGNNTKEELFLEGNEDEDKDPCEGRKAYKRDYSQSYRH
jgi:hypothetical protein